jgi:DNA processing protein
MKYKVKQLTKLPKPFKIIKNPPKNIYYIGDLNLLKKPMISIIGSRRPRNYTRDLTTYLANKLSQRGIVIVSGGAIGVDTIAHSNSYPNTIAVMANSLDIYYPAINRKLFDNIYQNSLALSEYQENYRARPYSFVLRNRLVVSLGECLIVTEADENSGSLTSIKYALEQGKKIFVFPHRVKESIGTQKLIQSGQVEVIYDIDHFIDKFNTTKLDKQDEILSFCSTNPSLNSALKIYGDKIYEYELDGKIIIKDLKVYLL